MARFPKDMIQKDPADTDIVMLGLDANKPQITTLEKIKSWLQTHLNFMKNDYMRLNSFDDLNTITTPGSYGIQILGGYPYAGLGRCNLTVESASESATGTVYMNQRLHMHDGRVLSRSGQYVNGTFVWSDFVMADMSKKYANEDITFTSFSDIDNFIIPGSYGIRILNDLPDPTLAKCNLTVDATSVSTPISDERIQRFFAEDGRIFWRTGKIRNSMTQWTDLSVVDPYSNNLIKNKLDAIQVQGFRKYLPWNRNMGDVFLIGTHGVKQVTQIHDPYPGEFFLQGKPGYAYIYSLGGAVDNGFEFQLEDGDDLDIVIPEGTTVLKVYQKNLSEYSESVRLMKYIRKGEWMELPLQQGQKFICEHDYRKEWIFHGNNFVSYKHKIPCLMRRLDWDISDFPKPLRYETIVCIGVTLPKKKRMIRENLEENSRYNMRRIIRGDFEGDLTFDRKKLWKVANKKDTHRQKYFDLTLIPKDRNYRIKKYRFYVGNQTGEIVRTIPL